MAATRSAPTLSSEERAAFAPLVQRARVAAAHAGTPVLLSFAATLPVHDPLSALDALGDSDDFGEDAFRYYWEQPRQSFALAAGGVAARYLASGAERFQALALQVQQGLATAVADGANAGEVTHGGPYALGGFSFFADPGPEAWRGFGSGQLVVPAWLVRKEAGRCTAIITVPVGAHASADGVVGRLTGWLLRLRAAAARSELASGTGRNRAFRQEAREDNRENWMQVVERARERIRSGALRKVVLARALDLACEAAPSPISLLRHLRTAYPDCVTFLMDPGAGEQFLGATPERLARADGARFQLAALAGTHPRGNTAETDAAYATDLLESSKEREEHQIVVEGIVDEVQALGRLTYPPEPQVLKLSNAQHLHTPITLEPSESISLLALLERLHPTHAVGGQPQQEALALIRESESIERGWYAGPIGWLNAAGAGEFAVALRAGKLSGDRLQLFAGGGIVADSDPEREYEETQIKFQPLLSALSAE